LAREEHGVTFHEDANVIECDVVAHDIGHDAGGEKGDDFHTISITLDGVVYDGDYATL
jgi:hypothetical protein